MKPDPRNFVIQGLNDQTIVRQPGQINGLDFAIESCSTCEIALFDTSAQVFVDDCHSCHIFLGPVAGSVFLRDCKDCVVIVTCQQLRTRDCENVSIVLASTGYPIIETSDRMKFASMEGGLYPDYDNHLTASGLELSPTAWSEVFDFNKVDGELHFQLLQDSNALTAWLTGLSPTFASLAASAAVTPLSAPSIPDNPLIAYVLARIDWILAEQYEFPGFAGSLPDSPGEVAPPYDPRSWRSLKSFVTKFGDREKFLDFLATPYFRRHEDSDALVFLARGEISDCRLAALSNENAPLLALWLLMRDDFAVLRDNPYTADLAATAFASREDVLKNFLRLDEEPEASRLLQLLQVWAQGDREIIQDAATFAALKPPELTVLNAGLEIDGISDFPAYELRGVSDLVRAKGAAGIQPLLSLLAKIIESTAELAESCDKPAQVVVIDLKPLLPVVEAAQFGVEIRSLNYRISIEPAKGEGSVTSSRASLVVGKQTWALHAIDGIEDDTHARMKIRPLETNNFSKRGSTSSARLLRSEMRLPGGESDWSLLPTVNSTLLDIQTPSDWQIISASDSGEDVNILAAPRNPSSNFSMGRFVVSGVPVDLVLHSNIRWVEKSDPDVASAQSAVKRILASATPNATSWETEKARAPEDIVVIEWNMMARGVSSGPTGMREVSYAAFSSSAIKMAQKTPSSVGNFAHTGECLTIYPHSCSADPNNFGGYCQVPDWIDRKFMLLEHMLNVRPSIMCLQEVDHFHDFFAPALSAGNFKGVWQPRRNSPGLCNGFNSDGVAVFWDETRFVAVEKHSELLGSLPVACALLRETSDSSDQSVLFVLSTHLRPGRTRDAATVRAKHVQRLQAYVSEKINSFAVSHGCRVSGIIGGDFNDEREIGGEPWVDAYARAKMRSTVRKDRRGEKVERTSDYLFSFGDLEISNFLKLPQVFAPAPGQPSDHFMLACTYRKSSALAPPRVTSKLWQDIPLTVSAAPVESSKIKIVSPGGEIPAFSSTTLCVLLVGLGSLPTQFYQAFSDWEIFFLRLDSGAGHGNWTREASNRADVIIWGSHEGNATLGYIVGARPDALVLYEPVEESKSLLELTHGDTLLASVISDAGVRLATGSASNLADILKSRFLALKAAKGSAIENPWIDYFSKILSTNF